MFLLSASISFPFFFFPTSGCLLAWWGGLDEGLFLIPTGPALLFFFSLFFQSRLLWFFFSRLFFPQSQSLALVLIFSVCFFQSQSCALLFFFSSFFFLFVVMCVVSWVHVLCVFLQYYTCDNEYGMSEYYVYDRVLSLSVCKGRRGQNRLGYRWPCV